MTNFDLIVIGGGPAGSTLATLVAKAGYDVLIIEKCRFPRYKVGESLLPATVTDLFDLLGIDRSNLENLFTLKRGATFSWGSDLNSTWNLNFGGHAANSSKFSSDTPHAFNVVRSQFDKILLDNARNKGVCVYDNCKVLRLLETGGVVNGVEFQNENGVLEKIGAHYVADASGQSSKLASIVGKKTHSKFFKKKAIWGYYERSERLPEPLEGNVSFQALDGNWLWHIPLNNTLTSVGVVTSAKQKVKDQHAYLQQQINSSPLLSKLLKEAILSTQEPYDSIRICSDYSYCYERFWRPGLVLVGDSACFVDVLLSSGVHLATYAGVLSAKSIISILSKELPEVVALNEYETHVRKEYAIFYDGLIGLYDMSLKSIDYSNWLRRLLSGSNGVFYQAIMNSRINGMSNSTANVEAMRAYNKKQLAYVETASLDTNIITAL
ncbi:NAD(P)/FAD-dependent oxidoreductase [Catenovulum sediminis]|uniref:NAD(P)/FAD-dependent oxidoreductase n=2 Tax=Catenovulum sediminis TaxID=1740262 RepID=A0ABV1RIT1_9ALTE